MTPMKTDELYMRVGRILQPLHDISTTGDVCNWIDVANARDEVRAALEAALSAAEPSVAVKPVAWRYKFLDGEEWAGFTAVEPTDGQRDLFIIEPLYSAPSALTAHVQDVAEVSPEDYMRRHDAAIAAYEANTPNDYRYSALALRKAVDAAFAVAAAPARQEVAHVTD
jgi:hypothetical protein